MYFFGLRRAFACSSGVIPATKAILRSGARRINRTGTGYDSTPKILRHSIVMRLDAMQERRPK
jgi:hypothetical protein